MDAIGLTHRQLEEITDNFSEERKIGQGAYGKVYRGEDTNGEEIAVKMLHYVGPGLDDKQFLNEFDSLRKLNHQNIVKLIGYCYETQYSPIEYNGRTIFAEQTYRALCLEYLHNGSLQKHLSDECDGLDWHTRYKIIRGACEGLKYLHEGFEKPIYHLDLKPDNILLDKNMVPKLADFGLSTLFSNEHTRITQRPIGTFGYLSPEYIERGLVSKKLDIFSLGVVMIKIISGPHGRSKSAEMPPQEVIDLVHANWRNRLQAKWSGSSLDAYCQQVMGCTQIALSCMEIDRHNRPDIVDIIQKLTEMETVTGEVVKSWMNRLEISEGDTLLEQVRVCAEIGNECMNSNPAKRPVTQHMIERLDKTGNPDWSVETGMSSSSAVQAENASIEQHQGVPNVQGETSSEVLATEPWVPLAPSDGACEILSVEPLQLRFPLGLEPNKSMISCPLHLTNRTDHHVIFRLRITEKYFMWPLFGVPFGVVPPRCRYTLALTMCKQTKPPTDRHEFFTLESRIVDGNMSYMMKWNWPDAEGSGVHRVKLMALYEPPEPGKATSEPMKRRIMIQSEIGKVTSLDVHPTEPWILVKQLNKAGIWNYQTQEIRDVQLFEVTSVKFVYRKQWFVAGVRDGSIYVYSCDTMKEICHLRRAHSKDVKSLAIHATEPYLLSASSDGHIKLWDYEKDWELIRGWKSGDVQHVAFNPKGTNIFATAEDFTVKIWNLRRSECTRTLFGLGLHYLDYFSRENELYLITYCDWNTVKIWDYQTGSCVKTLSGVHEIKVNAVCSHPDLPILITGSNDGTVCLWSSTTFELECTLNFGLGPVYALGCLQGSSRIVIGHYEGLVLTEIDLGQTDASMESH